MSLEATGEGQSGITKVITIHDNYLQGMLETLSNPDKNPKINRKCQEITPQGLSDLQITCPVSDLGAIPTEFRICTFRVARSALPC